MIKIKIDDLVDFLSYLLDKTQDCYYNECKTMIKRFLERNGVKNNE